MATVELGKSVDMGKALLGPVKAIFGKGMAKSKEAVEKTAALMKKLTGLNISEVGQNKQQINMIKQMVALLRGQQKSAERHGGGKSGKSDKRENRGERKFGGKQTLDCVCISYFSPKAKKQLTDAVCACLGKAAKAVSGTGGLSAVISGVASNLASMLSGKGKGKGAGSPKGQARAATGVIPPAAKGAGGGGGGGRRGGGAGGMKGGGGGGGMVSGLLMGLATGALVKTLGLLAEGVAFFVDTLVQAFVQANNIKMTFASTQGELVDVSAAAETLQMNMRDHNRTGIMSALAVDAMREKIVQRGMLTENAKEAAMLKNEATREIMFKRQLKRVVQLQQNIGNASYMIGASIEKTGQMFENWRLQFQMSSVQLSVMSSHMISLARNSGLMGDNLLEAVKSADKVIEKIQKMGGLTAKQARNIQDIMVAASKYGVAESTAKQLTAMTSLENFNKASAQERAFIFKMLEHMSKSTGQTMDVLMQKLSAGTLTEMENFQSEYAKAKSGAAKDFIDTLIKPADWAAIGLDPKQFDVTNLDALLRHLTVLSSEGNETATMLKNNLSRWSKEGLGQNLGELAAELKAGKETLSAGDRLKDLKTSLAAAIEANNTAMVSKLNKEIAAVSMRDEFGKLADIQQKMADAQALDPKSFSTDAMETIDFSSMFESMKTLNKEGFEGAVTFLKEQGYSSTEKLIEQLKSDNKLERDMAFEALNGMRMEIEKANKVDKSPEQKMIDSLSSLVNTMTQLAKNFAKWFADGAWMTNIADWLKWIAVKVAGWVDNPGGMLLGAEGAVELGQEMKAHERTASALGTDQEMLKQMPETAKAFSKLSENMNAQMAAEKKSHWSGVGYETPWWLGGHVTDLGRSTLSGVGSMTGITEDEGAIHAEEIKRLKLERVSLQKEFDATMAAEKAAYEKAKAEGTQIPVPKLATGGLVHQSGLAHLDAGEIVLPPDFGIAGATHGLKEALASLGSNTSGVNAMASGVFETDAAKEAMGMAPVLTTMASATGGESDTLNRIASSVEGIANMLKNAMSTVQSSTSASYTPAGAFSSIVEEIQNAQNMAYDTMNKVAQVTGISTGMFDSSSGDEANSMDSISSWISKSMPQMPYDSLSNAYNSVFGGDKSDGSVTANSMDYRDQTKGVTTAHSTDSMIQKVEMAKLLPQIAAMATGGGTRMSESEYEAILKVMAAHLANIERNTESHQKSMVIGAGGSQLPAPYKSTIRNISNDPIRGFWDWFPDSEISVGTVPHTGRGGQGT